jgi:hypothetical protein
MNYLRIYEAAKKYDGNTKWVFLFKDSEIRDFFVDYLWEPLENGFLSDLIKWTPGTEDGFANAITKIGGSKNGKNVLLYRDERYRPTMAGSFNAKMGVENGGMKDYVRKLIEMGKFDDAISKFDGTKTYSKDGDYTATIKSGLIGTPVSGKKIVTDMIIASLGMFVGPRQPGDEREQSAFYSGTADNDGELGYDSAIEQAIELLKKHGYNVTKSVSESKIQETIKSRGQEILADCKAKIRQEFEENHNANALSSIITDLCANSYGDDIADVLYKYAGFLEAEYKFVNWSRRMLPED